MGVAILDTVSLCDVADTGDVRLDPHHFVLFGSIADVATGLRDFVALRPPAVASVRNGENLPQAAYDVLSGKDSEYRYVSVSAISQFVLRGERCIVLKAPEEFEYKQDPAKIRCREGELLLTRSGTPGIAWPCDLAADDGITLIPSGFVIRVDLAGSGLDPVYAAAVLNHPVWRVWSSSLAGGKRQRNLSQEHVAELRIPRVPHETQKQLGEAYQEATEEIGEFVGAASQLRQKCDAAVAARLEIEVVSLRLDRFRLDDVSLTQCGANANLRLDARFHRGDVRASLAALDDVSCAPLGSMLKEPVIKRGQPKMLDVDDSSVEERVVATVSLQGGQIAWELTKPTDADEVEKAGGKRLQSGDVLIAMDGEGSIGKAAVFNGDQPAVTDSHVAALRTGDAVVASALACFLNSSLGQAQVEVATTGSTGQTQLSKGDLESIRVPTDIGTHARALANDYADILTEYEVVTRRVRRRLCEGATEVNAAILAHADLDERARRSLSALKSADDMLAMLDRLTPEMF